MSCKIRRVRRSDFEELSRLAGWRTDLPTERRAARRFRGLVSDSDADFYIALDRGAIAGWVFLTYARAPNLDGQRARVEQLCAPARIDIATQLLEFAVRRAIRRAVVVEIVSSSSREARLFEELGFELATGTRVFRRAGAP